MKIGILTHPLHYNYGGILQTWALQQVLKEMGHEPVKIDWYGPKAPMTIKTFFVLLLSWCKTIIAKLFGYRRYVPVLSPYTHIFRHDQVRCVDLKFIRHIHSTPRIYGLDVLHKIIQDEKFDAFIVGSDQVWRQVYCPHIDIFFLGFLSESDHRPRISYAASFGSTHPDIDVSKMDSCRLFLQRFDAVSVRELSGADIIRNFFNRNDAVRVLDPTLLLNDKVYLQLINKSTRSIHKPFISAYILDTNSDKRLILEDISHLLGLESKTMTCTPHNGLQMPSVSQWILNLAESSFVVTDSFHGCVFAIIFRKPFIAIGNEWRGLDRFKSLLEPFDLCNRLIMSLREYNQRKSELLSPIDYNNVCNKLDNLREFSLNFLKNALTSNINHNTGL